MRQLVKENLSEEICELTCVRRQTAWQTAVKGRGPEAGSKLLYCSSRGQQGLEGDTGSRSDSR